MFIFDTVESDSTHEFELWCVIMKILGGGVIETSVIQGSILRREAHGTGPTSLYAVISSMQILIHFHCNVKM